MKKVIFVLLIIALLGIGCSDKKNTAAASAEPAEEDSSIPDGIDVVIGERFFITQIYDISYNYKDYLGKSIKIEGLFKDRHWDGKIAYYVYRNTPGCCGNDGEIGYELSWDPEYEGGVLDDNSDQRIYPNINDWVEVRGTLKRYERSGFPALYLALSELNVMDKRGKEFVAN